MIRDDDGRFLLIETMFEGQILILANVYAPTKDSQNTQQEFLHYIHKQMGGTIEKASKSSYIIDSIMENLNRMETHETRVMKVYETQNVQRRVCTKPYRLLVNFVTSITIIL